MVNKTYSRTGQRKHRRLSKKWRIVLAVLAVLLLGLAVFWYKTDSKHKLTTIPSKPYSSSDNSQSSPKTDTNSSSGSTGSSASESVKTPSSSPAQTSDVTLVAPFGSFVSNHYPGKNGSPTTEQSVCNTTAGATCYLQFTKDGVTKKLDAKVADSSGSAFWEWNVKDAGFTAGSWQITAVATLNGQTKSTTDQINLEVSP